MTLTLAAYDAITSWFAGNPPAGWGDASLAWRRRVALLPSGVARLVPALRRRELVVPCQLRAQCEVL